MIRYNKIRQITEAGLFLQHSQYSKIPTPPSDFLRHEALKRLTSIKQQQGLGARALSLSSRAQGNPESASAWWQYEAVPASQSVGVPVFAMSGWCCNALRIPWTEQKSPSPPPAAAAPSIHPSICQPIRPHTAPGRVQHLQHNSFSGSTATHLPPWPTVDGGETHQVMRLLQPAHPAAPKTAGSPVRSRRTFPVVYNNPWECPAQTSRV